MLMSIIIRIKKKAQKIGGKCNAGLSLESLFIKKDARWKGHFIK